jgi:hypothetical protein
VLILILPESVISPLPVISIVLTSMEIYLIGHPLTIFPVIVDMPPVLVSLNSVAVSAGSVKLKLLPSKSIASRFFE